MTISILEHTDSGTDPYGILNEKEIHSKSTKALKDVGDLNPHRLLGDVLVIVLYHVDYSDPLKHGLSDLL